jgi:hypothetical protein
MRRSSASDIAGNTALATAAVISSWTAKMSPSSRSYRVSPDVASRYGIDQLGVDPRAVSLAPNAALNNIAHTEFTSAFLLWATAHVGEGEDGNRRFFR